MRVGKLLTEHWYLSRYCQGIFKVGIIFEQINEKIIYESFNKVNKGESREENRKLTLVQSIKIDKGYLKVANRIRIRA